MFLCDVLRGREEPFLCTTLYHLLYIYIYIYTSKAHCIKSSRTTVPPYHRIPSALKNQNLKKETVELHRSRWYMWYDGTHILNVVPMRNRKTQSPTKQNGRNCSFEVVQVVRFVRPNCKKLYVVPIVIQWLSAECHLNPPSNAGAGTSTSIEMSIHSCFVSGPNDTTTQTKMLYV
jgi:hypothetical protein